MEAPTENRGRREPEPAKFVSLAAKSPSQLQSFEEATDLPDISPLAVNESQLRYWRLSGYTQSDLLRVARAQDTKEMFMMASFDGSGNVSARLSGRTWERQEGHYPTMLDVCTEVAQHPLLEGLRGDVVIWLEDGLWTWQQELTSSIPIFAFGRHIHDARTLLIPDPAFWGGNGYLGEIERLGCVAEEYPWESRKETAFFRGAASGLGFWSGAWKDCARGRLVLKANEIAKPKILDAKLTRFSHIDEACRGELIKEDVLASEVPIEAFGSYKYLIDADGYCCAWRSLFLKMSLGAVVLKIESPYQQWYHHRLKPWKHYVPVAPDLSDFEAVYSWLREHDDCAREIALNGQQFVRALLYKDAVDEFATYLKHLFACQRSEVPQHSF